MGVARTDVAPGVLAMMRDGAVPGLSLVVASHDGVLYADGFGYTDLAVRTPATPDTSYLWFSMSKIATATAAMRLVDEGRLDPDAPITEYVAWPPDRPGAAPTMRQLLTHTGGLANPMPLRWVHAATDPAVDQAAMLRRLLRSRWVVGRPTAPRARYSNVGYLAAAHVIAAAARTPFERYLHTAILEPAGMAATGFTYGEAPPATGYVRIPRVADPLLRLAVPAALLGPRHGRHRSLRPFYVDGAGYGGLVGPVLDVSRLLRLHLGDGEIDGHRILSATAVRSMQHVTARGRRLDHAIGWFRRRADGDDEYLEHFGAGAGFWNVMRIYPQRGIGIAAMANTTSSYRFQSLFHHLARADWT
jgi:CubicO group peptidase (beta-lactamase class C family)